jgi:ATP-dependent RNA helicase DDX46/PRP5
VREEEKNRCTLFHSSVHNIACFVAGKGCPKPIKTWAQCGVSTKELNILKKLGFEKPTPIQVQAIPAIMSGRDLIGIAKTGSGKTLAFLLPMFRHILDQPPLEETDGPISIIMTPTRELCMQIGKDIKKFTKSLGLHAVCVYGGTGISEQIAELKRGAEIIVCTPGRMIDMLAANGGKVTNLRRVTYIVLDEADRMFDMGFEPQVMRIIDNVRPDRQTVMFSATFPRQMEALARRILHKPIEVQVGGRSVVCKDVEQHVVIIDEDNKFLKLLELLGLYQEHGSIIVFVDKQENADILLKELMKAAYNCLSLHGGIDQFDRDSTIIDFKSGKVKLLIATSVAARGLDVKQLILVVNYDCPNHYEDYVHRCGRTGRAGNKGFAYTFVTPEQSRYAGDIIRAFELASVTVPEPLRNLWDSYKNKQESEGKKVHSGGGFSGKGFKFDENEAAAVNERKKFQKAALGLADSDDEDLEHDIDQQIESMFATKRTVKEIKAPLGEYGVRAVQC